MCYHLAWPPHTHHYLNYLCQATLAPPKHGTIHARYYMCSHLAWPPHTPHNINYLYHATLAPPKTWPHSCKVLYVLSLSMAPTHAPQHKLSMLGHLGSTKTWPHSCKVLYMLSLSIQATQNHPQHKLSTYVCHATLAPPKHGPIDARYYMCSHLASRRLRTTQVHQNMATFMQGTICALT
jgi:hypothetical protein